MIQSFSKKITLFSTILGLLVAPGLTHCAPYNNTLNQISLAHTQVLESGLMSIMHELETSLAYWQNMEDTPFSYAVIRGPKGWISSETAKDEIQSHKAVLISKQNQIATCLGTLAHNEGMQDPLMPVAKCLEFQELTPDRLPRFHDEYLAIISKHLKPNHLIRNWTRYTIAAGLMITAGFLAYKHQDILTSWQKNGKEALLKFWQKNVKDPLFNTRDILFDRKHYNVVTKEAIEGDKNAVRKSLKLFLPKICPNKTPEEIAQQVEYIIQSKDTQMVMQDLSDQASHWGQNIAFQYIPYSGKEFRLGETTALAAQIMKLQANEATMAGQQAFEAIQLNVELLATFPVLAGLYGLKKGYDNLFHKKILSEPLQHRLMLIDKLLNNHNTPDMQLTVASNGYMRYHVHALAQYVGRIPKAQRKAFKADIAELNNVVLSVNQKMRVIDQMYRQYGFLSPLAI